MSKTYPDRTHAGKPHFTLTHYRIRPQICILSLAGTAYILAETVVLSIQMYLAKHMLRAGQTHGSHSRAFVVHLSE